MAAKKSTDSLLDRVVILGSSLVYLTKGATDDLVDMLEENKIISVKDGKEMAEKIRKEVKTRQQKVRKTVVKQLSKVIDELGIATKKDLEKLKK